MQQKNEQLRQSGHFSPQNTLFLAKAEEGKKSSSSLLAATSLLDIFYSGKPVSRVKSIQLRTKREKFSFTTRG
ncbi:hypothetical protein [Candidatus Electronema sp. PJ]|uniref:hypothetical protein n=1 Tax=Candidatus Electronema sp. PJ TaxID=3401572 RepID=UPI003AA85075